MMRISETKGRLAPHQLPIISLDGTDYYVDARLRQFREIMNPHNFVDFGTEAGRRMVSECAIFECYYCQQITVVPFDSDDDKIECRRCGSAALLPF